jgi:O-antigen biosynthesis protein
MSERPAGLVDVREREPREHSAGGGAGFSVLDHPVIFRRPRRLTALSAWREHTPFAMLAVDLLRPRTLVELGTQAGDSYCAFCEAVEVLGVDTRCYAVDHWEGDPHTGAYGEDVLADLRAHHDPLYCGFSRLVKSDFDSALERFGDGSIDLLHIDGYHTYDAVRHDFDAWLPKVSEGGVVLLHDTNVRELDYGAWRLWEEVSGRYPSFEFVHGHGLGVLAVGQQVPRPFLRFLEAARTQPAPVRTLFATLGERLYVEIDLRSRAAALVDAQAALAQAEGQLAASDEERRRLAAEVDARFAEGARMATQLEQVRVETQTLRGERDTHAAEAERAQAEVVRLAAETERAASERESLRQEVERLEAEAGRLAVEVERLEAESARLESEVERLEGEAERLEAVVGGLRTATRKHEAKLRTAEARTTHLAEELTEVRAELERTRRERDAERGYIRDLKATLSWRLTSPLRAVRRSTRRGGAATTEPVATLLPGEPASGAEAPAAKAVLYVSLGGDVARRYRCNHQAEELELLGATTDVFEHGGVDLDEAVERYASFILHRVPFGPDVERFLERAEKLGKPVVFDTDDLVFEPALLEHVAALERMPDDERELFVEGVERFRATLVRCGAVVVSTSSLAEHVRELHDRVVVAYNVAGMAMVTRAERVLALQGDGGRRSTPVRIAYMSGTPTHDRDFREATEAVLRVLELRPETRFLAVGPLALDPRFTRFGERVERLPLQSFTRLTEVLADVDVNLAPLERDNPFTEAKSCVKYVEAGLLGVPTIASPRRDFVRAIAPGRNGLLADTPEEWEESLLRLVDDGALRRRLGAAAREDVLERHTARARAPSYYASIADLVSPEDDDRPLTINWLVFSPVGQKSGGDRNIFRIKDHLAGKGHHQRIYVDPVVHLAGKTKKEILEYLEEAFGPLQAELCIGHDEIAPADVTIATHWPTAYRVAAHDGSLFKAYFVQDFEPDFYDRDDARHGEADRSYTLPLRHVCLGRHLADRLTRHTDIPAETVDFALDDAFQMATHPAERGDTVRVLFFARPALRRRGYQLGVDALRIVKEQRPDAEIVFFGSTTSELGEVPFEYTNLGVIEARDVAREMDASHILLTLSLTNISNVPFEGMACGCAVVDVDLPNVSTMVQPDVDCLLAEPTGEGLAAAVVRLIDDRELRVRLATWAAADASGRRWHRTGDQFEQALRELAFTRLAPARSRAR